jgi:hypothetical protein
LFCAVHSIAISLRAPFIFRRAPWRFFTAQSFHVAVKITYSFRFPFFFAALFRPLSHRLLSARLKRALPGDSSAASSAQQSSFLNLYRERSEAS